MQNPHLPPLVRCLLLVAATAACSVAADVVWIEGESAKDPQVHRHPGWYDQVSKNALSGDEWLHNFGPGEGKAEYRFEAAAGDHHFWVRANHIAGAALSWRLNGGEWKPVDFAKAVEPMNIANNGAPDMRFISWTPVGTVALKAGSNVIEYRMHSGNSNHGGLDCFVLSRTPFQPNGRQKPGEKLGLAMPGMWAFEPEPDAFAAEAVFDLRSLNEPVAGQHGWVKATPDGDFARGDGKKIRFWAINANPPHDPDRAREHARFLAKRGVNMVRLSGNFGAGPDDPIDQPNLAGIDEFQKRFALYKQAGIYTTLVPWWGMNGIGPAWGIHGRKGGNAAALLFWDETMQKGYKAWMKALLTRPNPYAGGVPIGQDPALAIFQTQNEDSMLFWTIQQVTHDLGKDRPEEREALCRHHARWLTQKYGSLAKVQEAWGNDAGHGDDFARGLVGFKGMWEWNGDVGASRRHADQLAYFSETMRAFNVMIERWMREEIRSPVLINAGNWRTANQVKMLDCERSSYDANAVIGLNRYVNGLHVGDRVGHLVLAGHHFTEHSTLLNPRTVPVSVKQVAGKPFIITESTWVPPISHQAEGPFLVAAYSALNGMDAYYWFAYEEGVGFERTIGKWQCANPAMMGGWPSAALMFRMDYVKRGEVAVHEERTREDLWAARGQLLSEDEGFDPNRDSRMPKEAAVSSGVDPLAFLVGPVEVVYGGDPAKNRVVDLAKHIDAGRRRVTSITKELVFDHGLGICTLDAPKAQGVTGFLGKGAGSFGLSTVTIASKADYAAILVVALDDKPLDRSAKVLVNVTSVCRPYGWKASPATFEQDKQSYQGFRIDDLGSAPWNVARVEARLTVRNPLLRKATVLDANGMRERTVAGRSAGGGFTVDLPPDALYVVLE